MPRRATPPTGTNRPHGPVEGNCRHPPPMQRGQEIAWPRHLEEGTDARQHRKYAAVLVVACQLSHLCSRGHRQQVLCTRPHRPLSPEPHAPCVDRRVPCARPLGRAALQRRQAQEVDGHLYVGGCEVVGYPLPHTLLHQAVKVHELGAAQLNILSDTGAGQSSPVLLALPPFPWEDHGVGGTGTVPRPQLARPCCRTPQPRGQWPPGSDVVAGTYLLTARPIQSLQGIAHFG